MESVWKTSLEYISVPSQLRTTMKSKTSLLLCLHKMQQGISATQRKKKCSTDIVREISEISCVPKHITFFLLFFFFFPPVWLGNIRRQMRSL